MPSKKQENSEEALRSIIEKLEKIHQKDMWEILSDTEELVYAVLSDNGVEHEDILKKIKAFRERYVDWNEVRVTRYAELGRVLDPIEKSDEVAMKIREVFDKLFDQVGTLSFEFISEMKIMEARKAIAAVEAVPRACADRIIIQHLHGASAPFSNEAISLMKKLNVIPKNGTKQVLTKLVSDSLSDSKDIALLYNLVEMHIQKGCTKSKCPLCK
jgi:hypothetical protein